MHDLPTEFKSPRMLRKHLMEEQIILEHEARRLAQLQLSRKRMATPPYSGPPMDEINFSLRMYTLFVIVIYSSYTLPVIYLSMH